MGFTQPHSAMPIFQDIANNVKGFTSRILWFFSKPVYLKYENRKLSQDEIDEMQSLQEELGMFLVQLLYFYLLQIFVRLLVVNKKSLIYKTNQLYSEIEEHPI